MLETHAYDYSNLRFIHTGCGTCIVKRGAARCRRAPHDTARNHNATDRIGVKEHSPMIPMNDIKKLTYIKDSGGDSAGKRAATERVEVKCMLERLGYVRRRHHCCHRKPVADTFCHRHCHTTKLNKWRGLDFLTLASVLTSTFWFRSQGASRSKL